MKILIVDDHSVYRGILRKLLERFLNGENLDVHETENGLKCLEIIEKKSFDLILMDFQMPRMNGIEATKKAISKHPDLKILGISMFATPKDQLAFKEVGALGFISKDQEFTSIIEAINTVLEGSQYFPELDFHHL